MNAAEPHQKRGSQSPEESGESAAAGTKRKRSGEPKYYAVKSGFKPGVYYRWEECLVQVKGFKGALCRLPSSTVGWMKAVLSLFIANGFSVPV
jgi:hypothetical protein